MNGVDLQALISRVEAFHVDDGSAELTFIARLARENRWSPTYAQRVFAEYKRFAILSVVAGHAVTPSEDVDQVWHLHLTYTHSYWQEFCPTVLGGALHHNPTAGGLAEHAKFYEWYSRTLSSYRRIFGEAPPVDVWPFPGDRFAHAGASCWVDQSRYWLIPKWPRPGLRCPSLTWRWAVILLAVLLSGCAAINAAEMNPLNFNGQTFLSLYIPLLAIGVGAAVVCRHFAPGLEPTETVDIDDPYLGAALVYGPKCVIFSALTKMVRTGELRIADQRSTMKIPFLGDVTKSMKSVLARGCEPPLDAPAIERVLYWATGEQGEIEVAKIVDAGAKPAEEYQARLRELGFIDRWPDASIFTRIFPLSIMFVILLLGVSKFFVGISRHKPVGILVVLLIMGFVAGVLFAMPRRLTPLGRSQREMLRRTRKQLEAEAKAGRSLDASDAVWAVALFGMAPFASHPELKPLYQSLQQGHVLQSPSSGGCGGGCGGGGGGGGCGGGGCGGCGGCGG